MNRFIKIEFTNSCDIPPYYFSGGFAGIVFLDADLNESEEDYTEEIEENGDGDQLRILQRGFKRYVLRLGLMNLAGVDLLHQLRLFDTIELTTKTGEVMPIYRVDFEHTWQFDQKEYATGVLRFDMGEVIRKGMCCEPYFNPNWQWLTGQDIRWQDGTSILHQ